MIANQKIKRERKKFSASLPPSSLSTEILKPESTALESI